MEDPTRQAHLQFPASSPGDQSRLGPCPSCHPLTCLGTLLAGLWDKVTIDHCSHSGFPPPLLPGQMLLESAEPLVGFSLPLSSAAQWCWSRLQLLWVPARGTSPASTCQCQALLGSGHVGRAVCVWGGGEGRAGRLDLCIAGAVQAVQRLDGMGDHTVISISVAHAC